MLNRLGCQRRYDDTAYNGPYNGALDGRITRDGNDAGGSIIPLTILHHNDSHGNLVKGTYVGYTQLATLIKQERAHNPNRTLLLNARRQHPGRRDDVLLQNRRPGVCCRWHATAIPTLQINPLMAAFNAMNYDAMTLGNHEFNFGNDVFTSTLQRPTSPSCRPMCTTTVGTGSPRCRFCLIR